MKDQPETCFSSPLTAAWAFKLATHAIDDERLPFLPREALTSVKEICNSAFEPIMDFIEENLDKGETAKVIELAEADKKEPVYHKEPLYKKNREPGV